MSVGAMNSVLYLLLPRHPGFGERPTWARPHRVLRHPLSRMELHCHDILGTSFHGLWLGASAVASSILEPHDRQIRGWARLIFAATTSGPSGHVHGELLRLLLRLFLSTRQGRKFHVP